MVDVVQTLLGQEGSRMGDVFGSSNGDSDSDPDFCRGAEDPNEYSQIGLLFSGLGTR